MAWLCSLFSVHVYARVHTSLYKYSDRRVRKLRKLRELRVTRRPAPLGGWGCAWNAHGCGLVYSMFSTWFSGASEVSRTSRPSAARAQEHAKPRENSIMLEKTRENSIRASAAQALYLMHMDCSCCTGTVFAARALLSCCTNTVLLLHRHCIRYTGTVLLPHGHCICCTGAVL